MSNVALHPVVVKSCADLNALLARFNLPVVPPAALEPLRAKVGRSSLVRALSVLNSPDAEHDPARNFLLKAINDACLASGTASPVVAAPVAEIPAETGHHTAPPPARSFPQAVPMPRTAESAPVPSPSSARPAHPHTAMEPSGSGHPHRLQVRAYGKRAALCAEDDETRGGTPTVTLELAPATGPRVYDWQKKVRFQLTSDELPQLLAVLCGYAEGVRFSNHGQDNKKWLQVEYQPGGYYIKGGDGESMLMLPVSTAGVQIGLYSLVLRQVQKAAFDADSLALLQYARTSIAPKIPPLQQREAAAGSARR